jgi:hypothetical protein
MAAARVKPVAFKKDRRLGDALISGVRRVQGLLGRTPENFNR